MSFEENRGQTDPQVRFLARGRGYTLFLTSNEAVLTLPKESQESKVERRKGSLENEDFETGDTKLESHQASFKTRNPSPETRTLNVLRMKLLGSNGAPQVSGLDALPGRSNYFIGNDPQKWRTNVPNHAKVIYEGVYPGVDLLFYGNQRQLEYDFVVAPGADPRRISLGIEAGPGAGRGVNPRVDADGDLVVKAGEREVRFLKPVAYQMQSSVVSGQLSVATDHGLRSTANPKSKIQNRKYLDSRYVLTAQNEIHFEVGPYDPRRQLIIDPVLSYSTYLGGSSSDVGVSIALDSAGSAYVTGETGSADFPTMNPEQPMFGGALSAFVTKLSADGSGLVYSTFVGGSAADRGNGIAVDSAGNAYIAGRTNSPDFPIVNAFQETLNGDFDAFVAKLSADGSALLYSSFFGGGGNDDGQAIAVDASGNAYVTGGASSLSADDFPITMGAFQQFFGGGPNDAFVAKFDPTQSGSASLVYSTFLGGSNIDRGNSIAVDSDGNAYVTGRTQSDDFPTRSPLQSANAGDYDVFVTKLNSTGTDLVYSTYLGGSGRDQGFGIAVDAAGNAYLTGETISSDFPLVNAFQEAFGGAFDAFVAKIDALGATLLYSTYLGGADSDQGSSIAVDGGGIVYVTGRTASSMDFPTTPDAFQPTFGGGASDAFVAKIDPSQSGAASLVYSSYLGGSGEENRAFAGSGGNPVGGIAVDSAGNAYVTGGTSSIDFPLLPGGFQTTYGGDPTDAFVVMITATGASPGLQGSATPEALRPKKSAR